MVITDEMIKMKEYLIKNNIYVRRYLKKEYKSLKYLSNESEFSM